LQSGIEFATSIDTSGENVKYVLIQIGILFLTLSAFAATDLSLTQPSHTCKNNVGQPPEEANAPLSVENRVIINEFQFNRNLILDPLSVSDVGGTTVAALKTRMNAAALSVSPWVCVEQEFGGIETFRNSARWWRAQNGHYGIQINSQTWRQESQELKPSLALHEYLGSVGIDDNDYGCSTSLWLLSRRSVYASKLTDQEMSRIENYGLSLCSDNRQVRVAGTSTGVGGGGDSRGLELKMILILRDLNTLLQAPRNSRAYELKALLRQMNSITMMGGENNLPQLAKGGYQVPNYHVVCRFFSGAFCL
jgi:hypothetical protein